MQYVNKYSAAFWGTSFVREMTRIELPAQPVFPSVRRLLAAHQISAVDAAAIPGTGVRGMLTKGDVLSFVRAREAEAARQRALVLADAREVVLPSWLLAALRIRALGGGSPFPFRWTWGNCSGWKGDSRKTVRFSQNWIV